MRMKYQILPLALSLAFFATGCSKQETDTAAVVRPVKAMQVGTPERWASVTFTGKAKAKREASVAFEVPGRIVSMPVRVGDSVEAGQELASLDARDYANNLSRMQAELRRSSAQADRISKALKSNAVAEQELTDINAAVDAAQAMVDIAEKQFEDCVLRAPFAGTIVARYLENYENVLAKQRVMRVLDISQIEMVVDVPENMIPDIPHITQINVSFAPFPDTVVSAWVSEVGSEASATTRTYPVTLRMDQPEDVTILAGMAGKATVTAELPPERLKEGITVLPSAVFSDNDSQQSYVWVFDESTQLVSRQEVTVDRFSKYGVVVTDGLNSGDWVVTAGVHSLTEGQQVSLLEQQL